MGHSYEESKKTAVKIIIILGIITICEVIFALIGKGHLIEGVTLPGPLIAIVMIVMSLVKAYLIVYEFMHMKYEVPGLVKSVLLPVFLLVWAVIAFFWEGSYWNNSRNGIQERNEEPIEIQQKVDKQEGMLIIEIER